MPTYEYECTRCAQRVEVAQRFSDTPLTICENCGGELRKVFSAVGVVFKGSGFYKTDSRPEAKSSTTTAKESTKDATTDSATASPAATPAPAPAPANSSTAPSSSSPGAE